LTIGGTPFIRYLQDRLHKPQTKALLNAVAQRFPAAVVMLDLASEMLAGATMEDVSTVLYFKVLQWAGYSRNLKVAAFERLIEKDGRTPELHERIARALPGATWTRVQNNPLAIDGLIPKIAHEMYPALFPEAKSFSSSTEGFFQFEDRRVREMIDLVREKSGKPNILFIVDEVGQYIASRDNLILNLDGLAKNLKRLGDGKAWIIATAQQTLTEDDPRAALNSDKLYKLKDRFPIQIDLESSDIKEICYRRLLGKSPAGETELGKLFDAHGQALRHNTKLQDAKYYDADFSKESFTQLYPFLPAHFDILLHLLGALAKSTGGIGLRSAIKVIQDVLKGEGGSKAMADQPVGWLATTITLYDELEKDIRRAFTSIHQAVGKVRIRFPDSRLHQDIAKSVAVLRILGNLPVSVRNVASLMHPSVMVSLRLDTVRKAVEEMLGDVHVPLGEKDGSLFTDASDAPQRLGAETSAIVDNLKWALEVKRVLDNGLDATLRDLQAHRRDIEALPDTGVPGELRRELSEDLGILSERLAKEDFYQHTADFNSQLTHLKGRVRDAVITLSEQQKLRLKEGVEDLQRIPEWEDLTQEERGNAVSRLDGLALAATQDLAGLKKLLARDYDINSTLEELKRSIQRQGQERVRQRMEEERAKAGDKGPVKLSRSINVPLKLTTAADLDALIQQLQEIKAQLNLYTEIELSFTFSKESSE
jgi:hypothetical protein